MNTAKQATEARWAKQDPFEFKTTATPSMGLWSHGIHLGWKADEAKRRVADQSSLIEAEQLINRIPEHHIY